MYIDSLPSDAKQIKGALDFVDTKGNVYGIENRHLNKNAGKYFIKAQYTNFGYKYCGIRYATGKVINKRVHKLVAEAFIPNPNNYPIVMHIDNNKANNCIDNLKWGTLSENTKQAVSDGLLKNRSGFEDEQSIPCDCYRTIDNSFVKTFGSVSLAAKEMKITKGGIRFQLNNLDAPIRKKFYFVEHNNGPKEHDIIVQYDFNTDREIARFCNIGQAEKQTGIASSCIASQVKKNKKPKWSLEKTYFLKIKIS